MCIVAAVDPHLKTHTNQLNRNSSRITKHEYEIEDLKKKLDQQATNVYISEPLSKQQQALFYRCRSLCKSRELKATWNYESVIYVQSWDDTQRVILEEGDLHGMMSRPQKDTPFTTPKSSLLDVSEGSFHGFSVMDPITTDNNTCAHEDSTPDEHPLQQHH